MSNHLRAFVRYNNNGKVVPSGMVFAASQPKTGKWKEIPITFCCSTIPFPTVSSNNKELKAYVRYDGQNKLVPGGPILSRSKPKVGNWVEITDNLCCQPALGCGAPYFINLLETGTNPAIEYPGTSCVDSDCNMVVGYTIGTTYPDPNTQLHQAVIIKYDKDGNTLWQKVQNIETPWDFATLGNYTVKIASVNVDSNNDIYVCDIFSIYKLSGVDGSLIWFKPLHYLITFPTGGTYPQSNSSLYINTNNELYLCFNSYTGVITTGCLASYLQRIVTIVKINPTTGDGLIEKTINISSPVDGIVLSNYVACFTPLTGDSNGNIFVSLYYGFCLETAPGSGIFDNYGVNDTVKFDNNLNYISNFQYNVDPGSNVFPIIQNSVYTDFYNLHLDKANNFYFNCWGNASGPDPLLFYRSKVDSSYNLQWCKKIEYSGALSYLDFSQAVADSDGNSYILATDYDSIGHLIKIDTNGNLVWATEITSSVGDAQLYNDLWYWNPNQLSISEDIITIILGTIDVNVPDRKAIFIKYPKNTQLLGTYGTTTFTDVTSQYTVSSLTPLIKSIPIIVTPTNYYTPNLTPYTYSIVPATNYTVSTTPI